MTEPTTAVKRATPWFALQACAWVGVVYLARGVLVPVALAILLTFLLVPLVAWVEPRVRSRVGAVLVVLVLGTSLVVGVLGLLAHQAASLAADLPSYRQTIVQKVRDVRSGAINVAGGAAEALRAVGDELASPQSTEGTNAPPHATIEAQDRPATPPVATDSLDLLRQTLAPILSPLVTAGVVVVLAGLILVSRESIRDRVIRLAGLGQISLTTLSLEEAGTRVAAYLRAQLAINSVYGAAVGAGLLLIGIPGALVCGLLAGLLRFVPALGVVMGAVLPIALSVAVFDDWTHAAMVLGLFIVLEVINNAALEPWLYGAQTGMSSLGVVLSVIFWTWAWGPIGLLMAVPLTVCALAFARQVPRLAVLPILLGDEPALSDSMRFYQRLLCGDEDEAADVLRRAASGELGPETLDAIALPALHAARVDLRRGAITAEQAESVSRAARELAGEFLGEGSTPRPDPAAPVVVCLPASDAIDQGAAEMLAGALRARGVDATCAPANLLLGEMLEGAAQSGAEIVVLSSVPPGGTTHLRRVCKAVRRRFPNATLVVGSWGAAPHGATGEPSAPGIPDVSVFTLKEGTDLIAGMASRAAVIKRDTPQAAA